MESGSSLWESLSAEARKGVLAACEENEDENNLMSLEEFKEKYKDWPLMD